MSTMIDKTLTRLLVNKTKNDPTNKQLTDGVIRVAITQGGRLLDLDVERPEIDQIKGNIYKGIISSIEPSLAAIFVNFGRERHGFLPLKEMSPEYFSRPILETDTPNQIMQLLKVGQPIIIQVTKEERSNKGAALSTYLSLAGSYLVLMPNNPKGGGISRRIEGEEREQLRKSLAELTLPEKMSVIIRTAGVSKSSAELQWDLNTLVSYFDALKLAATMDKPAPYLIHQESNVLIRTLRDYMRSDIAEIILDEESCYNQAYEYIKKVRPAFLSRVTFYQGKEPLYCVFPIEQQIESSFAREVRLPSGGSIVIDQTEALVAIDVNSARATKGKSIEETAFNTNKEAADEISRQLRLRDLGGLIVIDFIDMNQFKHQRETETILREATTLDRARIQIGRISRFGLLELSRQRLRSGTNKSIRIPCPRCKGTGMIRTVESLSRAIIHLIEEQAVQTENSVFHVQVPLSVATYLSNECRSTLQNLEQRADIEILILPCSDLQNPHFNIQSAKSKTSFTNIPMSYKLLKEERETKRPVYVSKVPEEPSIQQFLSTNEPKKEADKSLWGTIKKLFVADDAPAAQTPTKNDTNAKTTRQAKAPTNDRSNSKPQTKKSSQSKQTTHKTNAKPSNTKQAASPKNRRPDTRNKPKPTNAKKPAPQKTTQTKTQTTTKNEMGMLDSENNMDVNAAQQKANKTLYEKKQRNKQEPKNQPSQTTPQTTPQSTPQTTPQSTPQTTPQATPQKSAAPDATATTPANKEPIQQHVEQRAMTTGQRISPKKDTPKDAPPAKPTPKTYVPGKKISPSSPTQQSDPAPKITKPVYTPGKKIQPAQDKKTDTKESGE